MFYSKFNSIYDEHFPLKRIKIGYKNRKPWLTDALKKSIKRKNQMFKRKNKTKNPEQEVEYKKYRNRLNKIIHDAEREYYNKLFQENQSNLKNSWKILKTVINKKKQTTSCSRFKSNGATVTDKDVIANGFNNFFVNIGPNLAADIPEKNKSATEYVKDRNVDSMMLYEVSEVEVINIINNLKPASAGWDGISADVVKSCYLNFLAPLTHIMNISIIKGIVPSEMKIARVIPLFKSGDAMVFSNYRPVSVLPLF